MNNISATQIKAARAILNWLQEDLATAAQLSITTVRSLEMGCFSLRSSEKIRMALEKAGISFLEDDGVKRRNDQCTLYKGPNSCEIFFEDMRSSVAEHGGDILCAITSSEILTEVCGHPRSSNLDRLNTLNEIADIKCIMAETMAVDRSFKPKFQFRSIPHNHINTLHSYFVYGTKYAHVVHMGPANFGFVVFDFPAQAREHSNNFFELWDASILLKNSAVSRRRANLTLIEA